MTPALKKALQAIADRNEVDTERDLRIIVFQLRNELQVISASIEVLPKGTSPRMDAEAAIANIILIFEALEA